MTVDDESSIYVGGLPYDATEESVRRVFDLYGAIVAVKIINDQTTRGKCYGFVTFTNPRSAVDAINEMDGRSIEGRVVRVNKVNSRGGRSNFDRESFQGNPERGAHWDRGSRDREREYDVGRSRQRDGDREWSRSKDRDWSQDRDLERKRRREHAPDHDRARDDFLDMDMDMDREQDKGLEEFKEQEHNLNRDQSWERDHHLDWEQERKIDRTDKVTDVDKDQQSRRHNVIDHQPSRDRSSDSSGDYSHQVEELDRSTRKLDGIKKQTDEMEGRLAQAENVVVELQKKSQKLEDALVSAKKRTSYQQTRLVKMHKCFLQIKNYSERLQTSEQELKSLVESTLLESDGVDAVI